jgi:hypothetical protein
MFSNWNIEIIGNIITVIGPTCSGGHLPLLKGFPISPNEMHFGFYIFIEQ